MRCELFKGEMRGKLNGILLENLQKMRQIISLLMEKNFEGR